MNSANRQKLLQEYADQNRRPLQMKINNEAVIIPVEYTLSGSAEEIQKNFLADYFDQQKDERRKYKEAGIAPRQIEMNGAVYVVPFKLRNVERRDTQIVELVLRRAQAKYNRAVSLTRKLDRIYPERKYTVEVAGEECRPPITVIWSGSSKRRARPRCSKREKCWRAVFGRCHKMSGLRLIWLHWNAAGGK